MKALLMCDRVLSCLYRYILHQSFIFLTVFVILIPGQVFAEVSDGAHGGNEHFYFCPPLVSAPSPTGSFSATESPVVQICEYTGTGCVLPPIAEFTTTTGPAPERVKVVTDDENYIVNLNTKRYGLDPMKIYRIRVLFRTQEGVPIEKELGHADITVVTGGNFVNNGESILIPKNMTVPITFRIEEGFFPIGELTPTDRAKISPVLLEQFLSQEVIEPVEALVNVVDDQIPLPELLGVEILTDYRPTLAKVFVRISDPSTLASLVQDNNTEYVHENVRYYLNALPWQEAIGQDHVELFGYLGTGAAVVILDDGGRDLDLDPLWNHAMIDLSDPAFGGCTDVGTPDSCRVVAEINPSWADPCLQTHATHVARRVALTAPGVDIIGWDVGFQCDIDDRAYLSANLIAQAYRWVLQHQHDYNIVAVNMSFSSDESYSTEDCPTYNDESNKRLHDAGIMLIAGSGNGGQTNGVGSPACQKFVVSVGGSDGSEIWSSSTRGPDLDLLAPARDYDYNESGTSLSAPTVAGAWAILRVARPDLTLEETLEALKATGVPVYDPASGLTFPKIQIDAALQSLGLPVLDVACPCFTAEDLNSVEWDIWCYLPQDYTHNYLLDNTSSGDPGTCFSVLTGGGTAMCSSGSWYDPVNKVITEAEAEACAALINYTGTSQGTQSACRID